MFTHEQVKEKRVYINKKKVSDGFLIFLIFYGVRFVMVVTGQVFIHIPLIDESISWFINFLNNFNTRSLEILWLRAKYAVMK